MRWMLAGLAFALLVGLAVITVAMRARNLAARARIAAHDQEIMSLYVECARREAKGRDPESTQVLVQRLRELMQPASPQVP